jgi:Cu-Zn family superoxide dismutase
MNTITKLCLPLACCFVLACGSTTDTSQLAQPEPAAKQATDDSSERAPRVEIMRRDIAPSGDDKTAKNTRARARATLGRTGKQNRTAGTLSLDQKGDRVTLTGRFRNLPSGKHGVQIHDSGSCADMDKVSGAHFNPTDTRHGPPESSRRHVGDLGNIEVDKRGRASFEMTTDSLTVVEDGPSSVHGRSFVITEREDDGATQPDGNAGPVIACGVIREK